MLIVEDHQGVLITLSKVMGGHGFEVIAVATAAEALPAIDVGIDGLIADLALGAEPTGGIRVIEHLRANALETPAILLTGHTNAGAKAEADRLNACYVVKPGLGPRSLADYIQDNQPPETKRTRSGSSASGVRALHLGDRCDYANLPPPTAVAYRDQRGRWCSRGRDELACVAERESRAVIMERTGMSKSMVSMLVNGERQASFENAVDLQRAFGIQPEWWFAAPMRARRRL